MRPSRRVVCAIAVGTIACGRAADDAPARDTTVATPAAPRADSQVNWTISTLPDSPRHFVLNEWVNPTTLWGIAGENPVDIDARTGVGTAWAVRAPGARRSPNGTAIAWGDATGVWLMRPGGRPRRITTYAAFPSRPAGDPTNELLWSPDGRRLLTSWRDEGNVTYAVVDTASGALELIDTRVPGYTPPVALHWLDARRILFTASANASRDGVAEYRESGWRRDFVVHDLGLHTTSLVTRVEDGIFLDYGGVFADTVVAIRRRSGESLASFAFYDTERWTETTLDLSRGTDIRVSPRGAYAGVLRNDDQLSELIIRSRRPAVPHAAPVLLVGRVTGIAWSPDERAVAVSTRTEQPDQFRLSVIATP